MVIAEPPPAKPADGTAFALLALPIAGAALIWGWVGNMRLIENPSSSFSLIVAVVILGSAALVAIDNTALLKSQIGTPPQNSSVSWFFFTMFLWIVAFPAYLMTRSKSGATNFGFAGVLVALVFGGVALYYGWAIEEAMENLRQRLQNLGN